MTNQSMLKLSVLRHEAPEGQSTTSNRPDNGWNALPELRVRAASTVRGTAVPLLVPLWSRDGLPAPIPWKTARGVQRALMGIAGHTGPNRRA